MLLHRFHQVPGEGRPSLLHMVPRTTKGCMFESLHYTDDHSSALSSAKLLPLLTRFSDSTLISRMVATLCTMLGVDVRNEWNSPPLPRCCIMRLFDLDLLNFNTEFIVSQKTYDIG